MSDQELDSLFRKKLEQLEYRPSKEAWTQIESGTRTRHSSDFWFKIAASLLLLISAGIIIWKAAVTPQKSVEIVEKIDEFPSIKPVEQSLPAVADIPEEANSSGVESDQIQKKQSTHAPAHDNIASQSSTSLATNEKPVSDDAKTVEHLNQDPKASIIADLPVENTSDLQPDATSTLQSASDTKETDQGMTLEFNLEDFDKTTTLAAHSVPEETSKGRKEKKGLGKVIDLVKELKPEHGLGDLRDAKDEALTLNFKKTTDDDSE